MKESPRPQNSKSSARPAPGDSEWKRYVPWLLLASAAAIVLLVAATATLVYVLRGPRPSSDDEKTVLKNLEIYDVKYELDDKSRVKLARLEGRQVTDEALDEAVKLKYLKHLSLRDASVTDAGIAKLRELKRLEQLGITDTHVTDAGLRHLEKMPSLRDIWVCENDRLTKQGIASLKNALPGIRVHVMNQP